MSLNVREIWNNCLRFIKDNIQDEQMFSIWIAPIEPLRITEKYEVHIMVPSPFFVEQLEKYFIPLIWTALSKELNSKSVKIIYHPKMENNPTKERQATLTIQGEAPMAKKDLGVSYNTNASAAEGASHYVAPGIREKEVPSRLIPSKNFNTFVEGECNRLALNAGKKIGLTPGQTMANPLFVFGAVGLGKTHLAHAIGLEIKKNHPQKRILYIETQDFIAQFKNATRSNKQVDFIHFYQQIDVLIVDNIQFLSNQTKTQETFFAIFNHLHNNNKQIILTSDRATVDIQDIDTRLLSRFKWGLSAEIGIPDFETRKAIFKRILSREGTELDEEIIDYIAQNARTNVRELEGICTSLMAESLFNRKEITLDLAETVVKKIVNGASKGIEINDIVRIVTEYFGISQEELHSKTRKRHVVQARQLTMFLARKYTKLSMASIGKSIGGRDHATVVHACKTIEDLINTDKEFKKYHAELSKKM